MPASGTGVVLSGLGSPSPGSTISKYGIIVMCAICAQRGRARLLIATQRSESVWPTRLGYVHFSRIATCAREFASLSLWHLSDCLSTCPTGPNTLPAASVVNENYANFVCHLCECMCICLYSLNTLQGVRNSSWDNRQSWNGNWTSSMQLHGCWAISQTAVAQCSNSLPI